MSKICHLFKDYFSIFDFLCYSSLNEKIVRCSNWAWVIRSTRIIYEVFILRVIWIGIIAEHRLKDVNVKPLRLVFDFKPHTIENGITNTDKLWLCSVTRIFGQCLKEGLEVVSDVLAETP